MPGAQREHAGRAEGEQEQRSERQQEEERREGGGEEVSNKVFIQNEYLDHRRVGNKL